MQTQKFWIKPEMAVLADVDGAEFPVDPFKAVHHKQKSKSKLFDNFPVKPTQIKKAVSHHDFK